jgi:hypothetical protein
MRKIRFRGKQVNNGKWVYGFYDYNKILNKHNIVTPFTKEVIPETIGQFSGLLDMNNKEIYEGDVVKWVDSDKEERIDIVKWKHGGLVLCNAQYTVGSYLPLEIVGNIHDNAEFINLYYLKME